MVAVLKEPMPISHSDVEYTSHTMSDDSWMNDTEREIFASALELVPTLAAREKQCQAERNVPAETVAEFHRRGLSRLLQPKSYGGFGSNTLMLSRVVEELAMGCSSSAWVLAVFGEHAWILASLPQQGQEEIWGNNPCAVAASSLAPRAVAQRVAGGYRISGTYPFASGCKNAEWIIIGAWVEEAGERQWHYLLVPTAEVEILDDWQTLGLRGTGSNTIALHDVFVPEHRTLADALLSTGQTPGRALHPEFKLLSAPRSALGIFTQLPVTLALARRTLRHTCLNMRGRVSRGSINLFESQVVHMKIGEAAAAIESAILVAHSRHKNTVQRLEAGVELSKGDILACRRDSVWANRTARQGIETLVSLSSAEIVHDRNELQLLYRDALTTGTHFSASWEAAMVPYGRMSVGL